MSCIRTLGKEMTVQLASDKDGRGSSESLVMCLGDQQQLHSLCDFGGARRWGGLCVSIRHKAHMWCNWRNKATG